MILTLIFAFIGLWSSAQEHDMKRIAFANYFCKAVAEHDQNKVIKLTDKAYRTEQIKFLDGNKSQFVNEFFGGFEINTNEYINLRLEDIEQIEIVELIDEGGGYLDYIFHISSRGSTIERMLILRKTGNKFGFIGSQG